MVQQKDKENAKEKTKPHSLCDGIIYVVPFFFPYLSSAFFLEESVV
jgi:hypothetical protein